MIFTFCSKNSRQPHPVLKSLVNKCSVCVLRPYFSDLKTHKRCFLKNINMYIHAAHISL